MAGGVYGLSRQKQDAILSDLKDFRITNVSEKNLHHCLRKVLLINIGLLLKKADGGNISVIEKY